MLSLQPLVCLFFIMNLDKLCLGLEKGSGDIMVPSSQTLTSVSLGLRTCECTSAFSDVALGCLKGLPDLEQVRERPILSFKMALNGSQCHNICYSICLAHGQFGFNPPAYHMVPWAYQQ